MESRSKVKETVREILMNHGISDKDKLESIPKAVAGYFAGVLVEALMDFSSELADGTVGVFFQENWENNGPKPDQPS